MIIKIKKIFWLDILKVFLLSFAFVLLSFLVIFGYFAGFWSGYYKAFEDIEKSLRSLSSEKVEITPTPFSTLIPKNTATPSTKPMPTIITVKPKVSWGGPELWLEVNKKRQEYGVNPLNQKDDLCTIASIRLNELLEIGKLDGHEGFSNLKERRPDLNWIFEKYSVIAEFLAMGGETPQETVSLWDNTLGHKKILNGGEYVWGCIYAQNTFAVAITAY